MQHQAYNLLQLTEVDYHGDIDVNGVEETIGSICKEE